jgi:hypothetical protein
VFKEIIAVYGENHTKCVSKNAKLLIIEAGGTYNYRWGLNGQWLAFELGILKFGFIVRWQILKLVFWLGGS